MLQRGPPEHPMPAPERESKALPRRRAYLILRGAVAASALGLSSVAGAIGAFLALLPVALHPSPRGRLVSDPSPTEAASPEPSEEPIAG